ncbi:MAG: phosphoribosylformylglycinamidine synthase subunit PurL [Candidatus Omnitrophica bacterium]|nr:phosphoribosylformylglycinamidine synthase subunit PurL [Candidatus Omnitrophota bacterium]MDD5690279.1 phosphoribosylformylglycinamidine synthase subunit PurL [Candidatus Omnitrophota bacterium]
MQYKIEIVDKPGIFDAIGQGVRKDILDLGINSVKEVKFIQVYTLEGNLTENQVVKICDELLTDKIAQEYKIISACSGTLLKTNQHIVEVAYNPGVMDPVETSVLKGIQDLGVLGAESVKTAKKYILFGKLSGQQLKTISGKLLYNKLIQHIVNPATPEGDIKHQPGYSFNLVTVDLLNATDAGLLEISKKGQLFLNLDEMRQIQNYFRKHKRNPVDCELETIAQTWSEHCYHKTFRGNIAYKEAKADPVLGNKSIKGLLKSTIMKVTNELNKSWCVSVFKDNAGVIRFDEKNNICFKVETHNHPSALEPFGGANTGIGGVIRDPMGTGMGAKPILNSDIFCFAPPDMAFNKVPAGSLHPKRVMKGVVSGVRDYGNKMGIPTVNGAILFHEHFAGNPLVYCGTVGIMPKGKSFKKTNAGDLVVVLGGATGRDGIHGATFSSGELTHESEAISSGAVQIGNPIQEKKVLDTILQARDANLYSAITDCGAGGLSSAVGEMGAELGAKVYLDQVPLKYSGLSYMEIWISESQERMVLSVPPENINKLIEIFANENVEATVIGEFTDTKRLELYYEETKVCDLDMHFLHDGIPETTKKAIYAQAKHKEPRIPQKKNLTADLLKLLAHYDICSKEWVVRQYDHEVQGGSIIKPLAGIVNDGPSDASVTKPLFDSSKGIIISNGINFRFGFIDPYWMAASCIDEALRQIIAVGGSLKEVAILDNFCWGNPDKPDRLGSLVRAAYGCYDAAKEYGVPFISGKDSLYNEFSVHGRSTSIPGTLLISAISVMDDVNKCVSMYAKEAGNLIYVVGKTYDELGGSHYYDLYGAIGNQVPKLNYQESKKIFFALNKASEKGLVRAMHDCSDGGLGVALAEMVFSGGLGADIFLSEVPYESSARRNDFLLFSESNSRFVVEVNKKNKEEFERLLRGIDFGLIGCLASSNEFKIYGLDGKVCVEADSRRLKESWQEPLRW